MDEKGPWEAVSNNKDKVILQSRDLTHDVILIVDGDFQDIDEELEYAKKIAKRLNKEDKNALP